MKEVEPHKPRVLLVTRDKELASDYYCWLSPDYQVVMLDSDRALGRELGKEPGIVLMVDRKESPLGVEMPGLVDTALKDGFRVIRLADNTGLFDARWNKKMIHLPLGVRPKVLLAAIKGLHAWEAEG